MTVEAVEISELPVLGTVYGTPDYPVSENVYVRTCPAPAPRTDHLSSAPRTHTFSEIWNISLDSDAQEYPIQRHYGSIQHSVAQRGSVRLIVLATIMNNYRKLIIPVLSDMHRVGG